MWANVSSLEFAFNALAYLAVLSETSPTRYSALCQNTETLTDPPNHGTVRPNSEAQTNPYFFALQHPILSRASIFLNPRCGSHGSRPILSISEVSSRSVVPCSFFWTPPGSQLCFSFSPQPNCPTQQLVSSSHGTPSDLFSAGWASSQSTSARRRNSNKVRHSCDEGEFNEASWLGIRVRSRQSDLCVCLVKGSYWSTKSHTRVSAHIHTNITHKHTCCMRILSVLSILREKINVSYDQMIWMRKCCPTIHEADLLWIRLSARWGTVLLTVFYSR